MTSKKFLQEQHIIFLQGFQEKCDPQYIKWLDEYLEINKTQYDPVEAQ